MNQSGVSILKRMDLFNSCVHGMGGGGSSGGGGGGTTTNTVQKSDPWSYQGGYLNSAAGNATDTQGQAATGVYNAAAGLYGSYDPSYFSGQITGPSATVAPLSDATKQSIQMEQSNANNPIAAIGSTNDQLNKIMTGQYLQNGNPGLAGAMNNVAASVVPQTQSQFEAGNRYGSGNQQYATSQALANAGANMSYQNYTDAMNNISKNMLTAPSVAQMNNLPAQQMALAGQAQDAYNQANVTGNVNQWNWQQELPYNKLAQYAGIVQNGYPGGSSMGSVTQGTYSNPIASGIGGAILGGSAAYGLTGGNSAATGLGALGGGLLGSWY